MSTLAAVTPRHILRGIEWFLVISLLCGMAMFTFESLEVLRSMDWSHSDTYFLLLRRILAVAIGVELIRFILSYDIDTLLEILIFLLARQLLLMEINETHEGLLPVVIGIAIFIAMRIYMKTQHTNTAQ